MWKLFLLPMLVLQFTSVDRDFRYAADRADYVACQQKLEEMLPQATAGAEKAEVLWRLSRVVLLQAEPVTDKMAKRALYEQGVRYAEEGIRENPKNEQCYMWHCANIGRESGTHGLADQAKSVPVIQKDLTMILDKLGRIRCSEAWQAMSEYYWRHPLKSNDSAINYARRALFTIPSDDLRLSSYLYTARLLEERGWNAAKRAAQAAAHVEKFADTKKPNTERYAFYDGSSDQMPWLKGAVGEVSDREEATLLLQYALARYDAFPDPIPMDRKDRQDILQWQKTRK